MCAFTYQKQDSSDLVLHKYSAGRYVWEVRSNNFEPQDYLNVFLCKIHTIGNSNSTAFVTSCNNVHYIKVNACNE